MLKEVKSGAREAALGVMERWLGPLGCELIQHFFLPVPVSSTMAGWKMDQNNGNQRFSELETSIQFGDFPARVIKHGWLEDTL